MPDCCGLASEAGGTSVPPVGSGVTPGDGAGEIIGDPESVPVSAGVLFGVGITVG